MSGATFFALSSVAQPRLAKTAGKQHTGDVHMYLFTSSIAAAPKVVVKPEGAHSVDTGTRPSAKTTVCGRAIFPTWHVNYVDGRRDDGFIHPKDIHSARFPRSACVCHHSVAGIVEDSLQHGRFA